MSTTGRTTFCRRVTTALIQPHRLPIDPEDIPRKVLYEAIRIYCESNPRGYAALVKAAHDDDALKNGVGKKLKEIAWEQVIPNLTPDERANLDRTLRAERRPTSRPPRNPRKDSRGPGR